MSGLGSWLCENAAGRFDADIHRPGQIVGERVQRHPARDARQGLHQGVRCAHAHLQRAEWMLDRLAASAHRARVGVEPPLHRFENMFVLRLG